MRKRVIAILCVCFFGGILPFAGSLTVISFGLVVTEQAIMATSLIGLLGIAMVGISLLSLLNLFLVSRTKVKAEEHD